MEALASGVKENLDETALVPRRGPLAACENMRDKVLPSLYFRTSSHKASRAALSENCFDVERHYVHHIRSACEDLSKGISNERIRSNL